MIWLETHYPHASSTRLGRKWVARATTAIEAAISRGIDPTPTFQAWRDSWARWYPGTKIVQVA